MNARLIRYTLSSAAVLISTAGFMTVRTPSPPGCTQASLNGTYGLYRAGYSIGPTPGTFTPLGSVGFIVFDGDQKVTTTQVTNKGGTVKSEGWSFDSPQTSPHVGWYGVNSDCTFQLSELPTSGNTVPRQQPLPSIADGVIVGDELFMVSTGLASASSSVVTVVAKRMGASH